MLRLVPAERWHIATLVHEQQLSEEIFTDNYISTICNSTAYTLFYGERIVMCCGSIQLWQGVSEVWSIITDAARSKPKALSQISRYILSEYMLVNHRLQISVLKCDKRAIRFAEFLGFTSEGCMVYYGPNKETYMRYARCHH